MASCKDCLVYGSCDFADDLEYISEKELKADCPYFKNKVDFVEVVRCKDCDWYRKHEGGICVNPKCGKSWYGCPVPPEHFCSYGERRTE